MFGNDVVKLPLCTKFVQIFPDSSTILYDLLNRPDLPDISNHPYRPDLLDLPNLPDRYEHLLTANCTH